jgi:hypothetical protein
VLGTLLTAIQSTLTSSRSFLIGAALPSLLFVLANAGMMLLTTAELRRKLGAAEAADLTLAGTVLAGLALLLGFLVAALSSTMLEVLAGKFGLKWLYDRQSERFHDLHDKADAVVKEQRLLQGKIKSWNKKLGDARDAGAALKTCTYPTDGTSKAEPFVSIVRTKSQSGEAPSVTELETAVDAIVKELAINNADLKDQDGQQTESAAALHGAQVDVQNAIDFARDKLEDDRIRFYNEQQFNCPVVVRRSDEDPAMPMNVLAPTRLGNIARTVRSYGMTRYAMDLDVLWTRMQDVLQKKQAYAAIQEAKTQLDSMAALWWLTVIFTALWTLRLMFTSSSTLAFLAVAGLGPLIAWAWYAIACETYRVFADLVRSAVDLHRLDLLAALSLPRPPGLTEERVVWAQVSRRTGYGGDTDFDYSITPSA